MGRDIHNIYEIRGEGKKKGVKGENKFGNKEKRSTFALPKRDDRMGGVIAGVMNWTEEPCLRG